MKTLYVSDLDGTLLNSQKKVTETSARLINACIERGMFFTVATARMPYGCDLRVASLNLDAPGILTNGVFLYDFSKKTYLHVEPIDAKAVAPALDAFKKHGRSCFLYAFGDGGISIFYEDAALANQTQYYSERALASCREVSLVEDSLKSASNSQVVYLALTGSEAELTPIKESLAGIEGIASAYYLNIYNGLYCLEVFSARASKKNALAKLRELVSFDELVVFGDNLNDLSMIEVADRSYAPANALPEVKARVTSVLEDNDHDGVAKFLAREWNIGE